MVGQYNEFNKLDNKARYGLHGRHSQLHNLAAKMIETEKEDMIHMKHGEIHVTR
jgi:hypothetical protein